VFVSTVRSPETASEVSVPTLVMFAWAAVAKVPVIDVFAVSVVKVPAAGVAAPTVVPSIAPAPISTVGNTAVPVTVNPVEVISSLVDPPVCNCRLPVPVSLIMELLALW